MQAAILKEDQVLFEGVRVTLVEDVAQNVWVGFARLPTGSKLDEGEYELRLDDGRKGDVLVVSVQQWVARFRGLGPLV